MVSSGEAEHVQALRRKRVGGGESDEQAVIHPDGTLVGGNGLLPLSGRLDARKPRLAQHEVHSPDLPVGHVGHVDIRDVDHEAGLGGLGPPADHLFVRAMQVQRG